MSQAQNLFERIRIPDVTMPGAVEGITIDVQIEHIVIAKDVWNVKYKIYQAGTQIIMFDSNSILNTSKPYLQPLLGIEGAIQQAAVSLMPLMLAKLHPKLTEPEAEVTT